MARRQTWMRGSARGALLVAALAGAQVASAAVIFDNFRGRDNTSNAPAPYYLNNATVAGQKVGLPNLKEFAATQANIVQENPAIGPLPVGAPNLNWGRGDNALCDSTTSATSGSLACQYKLMGKVVYALVRFPQAGTYTFRVAHDDEMEVDFSTNFSAANAANYRSFDYNVPVGAVGDYTGGDGSYETVPGNFVVAKAGSCYAMRVYWNNRGSYTFLRMGWQAVDSASGASILPFEVIPETALFDPSDPASYANCDNVQTDLSVEKIGPATFTANNGAMVPFDYQVVVRNLGPVATSAATVADTLPSTLTVNSLSCAAAGGAACGTQSNSGKAYAMTTGALPVGGSVTYTFNVTPAATATSLTNTATLTTNDLNPDNNSSTTESQKSDSVALEKTGPATATAGQLFAYTLKLSNNSTVALNTPVVAEQLPPGVQAISVSGASCGSLPSVAGALLRCQLSAPIAAKSSGSFTLNVVARTSGTLTNYASTDPKGSTTPGTPGENCDATLYSCDSAKTIVAPAPAVAVSKKFAPVSIPVGGRSLLTLTIANTGSASVLTGLALTDTMPAGVTLVGALVGNTCGGTLTAPSPDKLQLSGGRLAAGASCTLQWNVTSSTVGSYVNTVPANAVKSNEGASNTQPATAPLTVTTPADLSTSKAISLVNGATPAADYAAKAGDVLT